jgi:DNA-binding CsgD family transcriptional regulator
MAGGAIATDFHARVVEHAGAARGVSEIFAAASVRLRRAIPFDAAVWLASDPATGLPTAPTRIENLSQFGIGPCLRNWELEFAIEDVNQWRTLARAEAPAGALRLATDDRPARSPRYRDLLEPCGFDDELRVVLRADGVPWALVALFRADDKPGFGTHETALVAALSEPLATAIRERSRAPAPSSESVGVRGPGLLLFSGEGELLSGNDDALAWLDELADAAPHDRFAFPLPMVVVGTLMRARAIAEERDHGSARARIRSRTGRWLVCHASCLRDKDGAIGDTALVIEPAAAAEIAPLITEAYELSRRERQITQLITRGVATAEIAVRLHLSRHTVRDYIKAIFEKVGVSSRGELVATLFAEHYAPAHFDPTQIDDVQSPASGRDR